MKTWFTADLHIGHKAVAELRGYADPADHDAVLAENWDRCVGPNDLVWVLGDLCIGGSWATRDALAWITDRPGRKRLILGNHDKPHPMHRDAHVWMAKFYYLPCAGVRRPVFEHVSTAARIRVAGRSVLLSHFPYRDDHTDVPRYDQWRLRDQGELLIHGHTHSAERIRGREIHVGLDAWGFKPVALHNIELLVEAATTEGTDRMSRQIRAALEGATE